MKSIENVISMVDEWQGKEVDVKEITEGITNKNYKVTVEGKSYVVRIPGEGTDLFIDRDVELHNMLSASDVGVGAYVFRSFDSDYVIITEFIQGRVMSQDLFKQKDTIIRAVEAIKEVNHSASFISQFIMFDKFDEYQHIVKKHSITTPDNFNDAVKVVDAVREKFVKNMPKLVSCHNDLLSENFIDQGKRMRIIDWELSGLNEPCFELGDFSVEQGFDEEEDTLIIETYFGKFDEQKFARMNIYKYMADILWTLWAVIQNHLSSLYFDYWNYGLARFHRAMNAFNTEAFHNWLKIA